MNDLRRTPLYDAHRSLGGRMVPFAGWEMPVQYAGVIPEHVATRTAASMFDVSHMGEIVVRGKDALALLDHVTCNDVSRIQDGGAQYNALLNEQGGVVDDVIVYRRGAEDFLVCVNASNTAAAFEWIRSHAPPGTAASVEDESPRFGQIALQGPKSAELLGAAGAGELTAGLLPFTFRDGDLGGVPVTAARTGYTGEDGFEFFVPWERTAEAWAFLLRAGATPAGLGARDTLRLEACYPLHGHELTPRRNALESGLGWIVKEGKGRFIGRPAVGAAARAALPRKLVGLVVSDGIARAHDVVADGDGKPVGEVTSGTKTPTVGRSIALAVVDVAHAAPGAAVWAVVRGRLLPAKVVKPPFYSRTAGVLV